MIIFIVSSPPRLKKQFDKNKDVMYKKQKKQNNHTEITKGILFVWLSAFDK